MEVTFSDGSRMVCEDEPFTEGGEGRVYFNVGKTHVIKLYFDSHKALLPANLMPKRTILENILGRFNLTKEDPGKQPFFGWPDAIVTSPGLGIRMPLVRDQKPLERYISPKFYFKALPTEEKGPWSGRVSIVYKMARIFRWMHLRGLCHSDLNPKNFLVNLKTGKTSLIDCDGLVVPGFADAGVFGMKKYMAPEIVMGNNKVLPSINTDKFSLAVLIYQTLMLSHPLVGPKFHHTDVDKDEELAFGAEALYIEHPTDHSNRPNPLNFTTNMLTTRVKNLFLRAFTEGLHNPIKRPQPGDWEAALMRMADRMVQCQNPRCDMASFVVPETNTFNCPWCKAPYRIPQGVPALYLFRTGARRGSYVNDDWTILGSQNRPILRYHVDTKKTPETSTEMVAHFSADSRSRWFLVNDCLDDARVIEPATARLIAKGTSVEIKDCTRILFGQDENFRVGEARILRTS